ncbi:MAG: hypothetical protein GW789_16490, partial [Ignavibacteria bacterium]|nr:hypothetical protein [Ignavibacteria bacterium]
MFKRLLLILTCFILTSSANSQWQQVWSSDNFAYNYLSGWIDFDKVDN